jgi:hypothetical protein
MKVRTLSVQQINALRKDPSNYEAHRKVIEKLNEIVDSSKVVELAQTALSLSAGFGPEFQKALSGGAKRGTISITVGSTGLGANPTITLNFPVEEFEQVPFAVVAKAGGTGTLGYSYTVNTKQLVITLNGTPSAGETYVFSYMVSE